MSGILAQSPVSAAQRIEELGRIILAYSEVTEKLQQSHAQLTQTVEMLREELSDKNQQLERRNRLAALGEMAAGLAHEIRNPLGGIQLYASLLMKDLADQPAALTVVGKISAGVKRLEALVGQTLQFSREIVCSQRPMDLAETIEQVVDLTAASASAKRVHIVVEGPRPMEIVGDPILLGQTIMNLLLNAIEAMPSSIACDRPPSPGTLGEGGGEGLWGKSPHPNPLPEYRERGQESTCDCLRAMPDAGTVTLRYSPPPAESPAKQFHLIVRDSGPGIPTNVLDRIFNPFFTTKDSGTGLGLSIVHRVVEAHSGTIHASNDPGGGAKFEVRI